MKSLISDFRLTIAPRIHPLLVYVDRLLDFFSQPMEAIHQSKNLNQKSKMVESLTGRELEILYLIAQGHSNTEISQRLYLALSTVKGHNLRIFNKPQSKTEPKPSPAPASRVCSNPQKQYSKQYLSCYPAIPPCRYIEVALRQKK